MVRVGPSEESDFPSDFRALVGLAAASCGV